MSNFTEKIEEIPAQGQARAWLAGQLNESRPTLLAFADDGVIWGRLVDGKLVTGPGQPELRDATLQQAFVFGKADEVRLFRDELGGWQARRVFDAGEVIVESQILWGEQSEGQPQGGFLQVSEYRKGIPNQYLPVDETLGNGECVRLEVHHLVGFDQETGEARIMLSHLAGLSIGQRAMEVEK